MTITGIYQDIFQATVGMASCNLLETDEEKIENYLAILANSISNKHNYALDKLNDMVLDNIAPELKSKIGRGLINIFLEVSSVNQEKIISILDLITRIVGINGTDRTFIGTAKEACQLIIKTKSLDPVTRLGFTHKIHRALIEEKLPHRVEIMLIKALLSLLKDQVSIIRQTATITLAAVASQKSIPNKLKQEMISSLKNNLHDRNEEIREYSRQALEILTEQCLMPLQ